MQDNEIQDKDMQTAKQGRRNRREAYETVGVACNPWGEREPIQLYVQEYT